MNLTELKAMGAVVDLAPVRKSVEWTHKDEHGEERTVTFDVFITRLSFGMIDRLSKVNSADRSSNAELIAASVRLGEDAEERMPYDIAFSLHPSLALELVRAIGEVNKLATPEESDNPKD